MAKIISVSNEVYEILTKLKGDKSYTIVIKSLIESKMNKEKILSFAGKIKIDEKEIEEIRKEWNKWPEKYV